MPNIPVRLGGNYPDLYEAQSSVSLNHTAGLLQRKNIPGNLTKMKYIHHVYLNESLMLWQLVRNLFYR